MPRLAARVLVIDKYDRLLLIRGFDPAEPDNHYWFTPGGGLADGEDMRQGAVRELYEETGLLVDASELSEVAANKTMEFSFDRVRYRQTQSFFAFGVEEWQPAAAKLELDEQRSFHSYSWRSAQQLTDLQKERSLSPADLPELYELALAAVTRRRATTGPAR
ncbi:NUDIX domain-containing protein [Actinoplanes sp. NEAU-H7]|uniref:NUDIX domain-containing protein n=1 Tax=Actinoplanes flavus TaxID=2820290 RepID=A0ABS3USG4_9ACTN|nr:NUDIX domain-containing protein [Actinoplanes flavus]